MEITSDALRAWTHIPTSWTQCRDSTSPRPSELSGQRPTTRTHSCLPGQHSRLAGCYVCSPNGANPRPGSYACCALSSFLVCRRPPSSSALGAGAPTVKLRPFLLHPCLPAPSACPMTSTGGPPGVGAHGLEGRRSGQSWGAGWPTRAARRSTPLACWARCAPGMHKRQGHCVQCSCRGSWPGGAQEPAAAHPPESPAQHGKCSGATHGARGNRMCWVLATSGVRQPPAQRVPEPQA